jgi:ribosomal protein S18
MRKFDKNDFNWKDTALFTQFMTKAGRIKNRYQTRLPDGAQTKLKKTVK